MTKKRQSIDDYIREVRERERYDPHPEEGGYLIPEVVRVNTLGTRARLYRWLGRVLNNPRIFEKGRHDNRVHDLINRELDRIRVLRGIK